MLNGFCVKPKKALYITKRSRARTYRILTRCPGAGAQREYWNGARRTASRGLRGRRLFAGFDGSFGRADEDMRVAAFQARLAFDRAEGGKIGGEAHQQLLTEIRMGDLAAAE